MTAPLTADVLIVGAGPAGAITAAELARHGLRAVLAGEEAGEADYDLVLSGAAMRGLASLGALEEVAARVVDTVELRLGQGGGHVLPEAVNAACERRHLVGGLRRTAIAAGAIRLPGRVTDPERRDGAWHASIGGATVSARHLVVATGAPSGGTPHATGLLCAQRYSGVNLTGSIVLALPAPRTIDPAERPTCVWAVPGAQAGTCTIGASRLGPGDPDELLEAARAVLAEGDRRFAGAVPAGPPVTGVLNSGFAPEHSVHDGRLLVGDAAGLVNPFTGEGLSYAVQSALLAARAIAAHPDDPDAAGRAYTRRLSATFVGYFETATHAARRYHLAWRVLVATAGDERPVSAKVRRAVLTPDGFSGLTAADLMPLPAPDVALLGPFLLACDEVAVSAVRKEWPFIARLLIAGEHSPHRRLRPAAPFFAALLAGGKPPDAAFATLAAAIELATLGALAFLGPMPPRAAPGRRVDWAVASTVLAGDFLLAQASRLVAASAPEVSWSFADWLGELAALRAARVDPAGRSRAGEVFAALLEFPSRVGAQLGGASPETVRALRDFGHHSGYAFLHAEEVLAVRGERTRLDVTLPGMLSGRLSAIPDVLPEVTGALLAGDPGARSKALDLAVTACRDAHRAALGALENVAHPVSARILESFVATVCAPGAPAPPSSPAGA
ncbi:Dehydrogenase (flavoprotein) [Streptosporangium canum]|uniref:Dehydrogenase (Flavoprotein) n=1 Tax=Streptosporangium canum TaxID=324952 RepID=A0A1I3GXS0_9ACTN|nr:FAD-dependent monooxygenase [Streptosporangium canum]SFI28107.1 Dehydrogenase (flavoprotein) [Streptosporangium canum]